MRIRMLWAWLFLATIVGCQPKAAVEGRVTYRDKVLTYGNVKVMPTDGIPRDAQISAEGMYQFRDLPCGKARFIVSATSPEMVNALVAMAQQERPPGETEQPEALLPEVEQWSEVPVKYGDFNRSGLSLDLKPNLQSHDLELH